ncbi:MAG: hypothetical protein WAX69_08960 [Victivallales bacterium]
MMKNAVKIVLSLLIVAEIACLTGCESSQNQKNSIRTYPINRPSDWEKNNNMPSMKF